MIQMVRKEFLDSFKHQYKDIQSSSLLVFLKDLEGRILYCSDSFEHFINSGESLKGKKVSEIFKDDTSKIKETDAYILQTRKSVTIEVSYRDSKEKQKWLKLDKMPYVNNQEEFSGILVFATDISDQEFNRLQAQQLYTILNAHLQVEETLKNTSHVSDFPETLVENLSSDDLFTAVLVERILDTEKKHTNSSASWHLLDGTRHAIELKNSLCSQCREQIENDREKNYFIKEVGLHCPWSNDFGESRVFACNIQYGSKIYGILCIRLQKEWQVEERTNSLLNQLAGKIAFGFYTLETQEQIMQIQDEMERQLKTYKIALDAINDGVWEWNLETNQAFFSDKYYTMLGYEPGDFKACFQSWEVLVHPEDVEEAKRIIKLHFENKQEAYEIEFRMKTKSGTYKWILGRGKVYERDEKGNPKRVVGTHVDISELKQKEEELAVKNEQLESVNEELKENNEEILQMNQELEKLYNEQEALTEQLNRMLKLMGQIALLETSEEEFLEEALDLAINLVPKSHRGRIRMKKENHFKLLASMGIEDDTLKRIDLNKDYFSTLKNAKIVNRDNIMDYYTNKNETVQNIPNMFSNLKESIITPIKWNDKVIGSIEIDNINESDAFTITDIKKMDSFSNLLSVFYRLRKYINEEGKFQTDLILTLVKALEFYDEYTRGHSERVAKWSVELARVVGVSAEGQKKIYYASLMHDIGKIFVQQSVLNKVSPLTEEEFNLIQIHPVKSAELINKVEGMESFARIVRHHHEKYSGKGYPDGLTGKAIPYFSRIITVADAYDAMTSERPYRRPLTPQEAAQELRRCKETQFDPTLVDPFIEKVIKIK